jgi:hypothetical protein
MTIIKVEDIEACGFVSESEEKIRFKKELENGNIFRLNITSKITILDGNYYVKFDGRLSSKEDLEFIMNRI